MLDLGSQQPLRQVDLKAIPGVDVVDGPADGREVTVAVEGAGDARMAWERILRGKVLTVGRTLRVRNRTRSGRPSAKHISNRRQPTCRPISPLPPRLRKARRSHPRPVGRVVPGDHPVVDADCKVRDAELVELRAGDALDRVLQTISKQAGD